MTSNPVTCRSDDNLAQVAGWMTDHQVGFVPVVDQGGKLTGVITDRDALVAAYRRDAPLRDLSAASAMSCDPVSCTIHDEVTAIEHRMANRGIRRLVVVDERGAPVGVVTLSDIARASLRGHEVSSRTPTWVLAAISQRKPS